MAGVSPARAKHAARVLGRPKCGLKDLWDKAIAAGAPAKAVAVTTYNHRGYQFRIDGTDVEQSFGFDCAPGRETGPLSEAREAREDRKVDRDDRKAARDKRKEERRRKRDERRKKR